MARAPVFSGDPEKMRTSPFDSVTVDGIEITSRYTKADEFDLMARVVSMLRSDDRRKIASMWCDSKATHTYSVTMRRGHDFPEFTALIGRALSALFVQVAGGHNGIVVGAHTVIDPDWNEDRVEAP